jgi:nitroimidazol reductase NimA-like FMN-containing flavoprotein (pyridoxamine 5'-phosphate oxidase superfamily)
MARKGNRSRPRRRGPVKLKKDIADFVARERVCRVATAGPDGMPHLVPVCHVLYDGKLYFGSGNDGRKVLNVKANAHLAATVDLYSDAWKHLRGVMLQGTARVVDGGPEFRRIRSRLYEKYPQYEDEAAIEESDSVIVELTPTHVFTWGLE